MAIKEAVADLYQFKKYLTEKQQEHIDSLDLDHLLSKKKGTGKGNTTCTTALDILIKNGKDMTNEALHHAYIDTIPPESDAMNYTSFNIAIRPLINSGTVIRTFKEKGNSKTAVMSISKK